MEEDAGVKAPVTRLRRRLSVEQSEENKSPGICTPTKRRGRKKPDLELIDENTPENTKTQRTRKAAVKDAIEAVEEKPVTPSRRSTRIKSNTSIVSETAVAVNSPRAKRATRRASQVGSDNEAPPTPARTTRRTRKDSASSMDKVEVLSASKPAIQITEVIVEEPETNSRKSRNSVGADKKSPSPNSFRKSPRLMKKQNESTTETVDKLADQSNSSQDAPMQEKVEIFEEDSTPPDLVDTKDEKIDNTQKDRLSISSSNLIKDLDTKEKNKITKVSLNKSNPVVKLEVISITKRNRSMSCMSEKETTESNFFSDNESMKKKNKEKMKSPLAMNRSTSENLKNTSVNLNKSKNNKTMNSFTEEDTSKSIRKGKENEMDTDIPNKSGNKTLDKTDGAVCLLYNEPSGDIKTLVIIEDSDSNSGKTNVQNINDSGDQCVPVIDNPQETVTDINNCTIIPDNNIGLNKSKNRTMTDNSCEPMDVDETIPDSMVIPDAESKEQETSRKSWPTKEKEVNLSTKKKNNESQSNENKSTLVLSYFKDTSVGKSPKPTNKLLSKSAIDLDVTQENEMNNKNLSLNYLTSTPLQHKSIQKLAMQVNTSIIASSNDSKQSIENFENNSEKSNKSVPVNEKDLSNKENKLIPSPKNAEQDDVSITNESSKDNSNDKQDKQNLSKRNDSNIDKNEESDDDSPMKISKAKGLKKSKFASFTSNDSDLDDSENESAKRDLLDDEAQDMGDDYESGDSQGESEKEYEKENEIIERGETLTSENDDISNDSEYEKDSFVVSSDEEDDELLEGTADDLSISDNELKMTAKSKKKYDERKRKEQKRASREMYESRHKINTKSQKNTQQDLNSSDESSESENESEKPKKSNRMRLDSSHDIEDEDISISKKKIPRLTESICEEDANEKEITIANESLKENDPLSQIKEEQKTPIKNANETIAFIDSEDNYDKNESTKTQTELQDPLEDEDDDSENSLESENKEIMQNYDSMLNNLNKTSKMKRKTKTCDISLNLDKKPKNKAKNSLVDELNLTQVKSTKKAKNIRMNVGTETKETKDEDESSDSIDIHLLFSEDSNDSEAIKKTKKKDSNVGEEFIPLKRTEAKSNMLEDSNNPSKDISLNRSAKKNKKRKSQLEKTTSLEDENNVSFFIDTEGTHNETINTSHNKSLKNKNELSISKKDDSNNPDSDKTSHEEVLIAFDTSKKDITNIDETDSSANNKSINKSITKTPGSAKNKNTPKKKVEHVNENSDSDAPMEMSFKKEKGKSKLQETVEHDETEARLNKSLNKSLVKTPVSEKKKKMTTEDKEENNKSMNRSLIKTPKKEKKRLTQDVEAIDNTDDTFIEKPFNKSIANTTLSAKKKKKAVKDIAAEEINNAEPTDTALNTSMKVKKKSISELPENNSVHEEPCEQYENLSLIKTPGSNKKKKLTQSQIENDNELQNELSFNKSVTKTPGSEKKKKKSMTEEPGEAALNVSIIKTPGSQKKNLFKENNQHETSAKKLKRKLSLGAQVEESDGLTELTLEDGQVHSLNESLVLNQKKKRKISQQDSTEGTKQTNKNESQGNVEESDDFVKVEVSKKQKRKKRKQRDEDEGNTITKISKQNVFDKAPVSRLPTHILQQLEDKPQPQRQQPRAKKPKALSTTQFIVEEIRKRKAKPSNYLEESVYVDDDDDEPKTKKTKGKILHPKVLPFLPTASTSSSGYTSTFQVNIVPKVTKFVAQASSVANFKDDYLYNKKIKRQGTYELYKRNRNLKISKF